jgi:ketosteroid isomerase-like protein
VKYHYILAVKLDVRRRFLRTLKAGRDNGNTLSSCLVGLAISFAVPAFAQQKDTPDLGLVQQRDLLGDAKAIDEFGELHRKLDEAYNKNDTAAVAALFTKDALLVEPGGIFSGRQAIAERYADTFQKSPVISFNCSRERRYLNAIDNAVVGAGQWTGNFQRQTGPVFTLGYWSAIYLREGDDWKIRVLNLNEKPPLAAAAGTK